MDGRPIALPDIGPISHVHKLKTLTLLHLNFGATIEVLMHSKIEALKMRAMFVEVVDT